jgi:hypothetical protein
MYTHTEYPKFGLEPSLFPLTDTAWDASENPDTVVVVLVINL